MEHKFISATWKTKDGLEEIIKTHQREGWSVAALGEVFGGQVLILTKDGNYYEHDIISTMWKTSKKLEEAVSRKGIEGWQVCAVGECFGSGLLISKKRS